MTKTNIGDKNKGRVLVKRIHGHLSLFAKSHINLQHHIEEKIVHSPQAAPKLTSDQDLSLVGKSSESLCEQCSLHSAVSPSKCKLSGVGIVKVILEIPARRCIEGRFSTKSASSVATVLGIVHQCRGVSQHQCQGEWFKEDEGIKERCTQVQDQLVMSSLPIYGVGWLAPSFAFANTARHANAVP